MDENDFRALALYYGREKYFNTMQKLALEGIGKFSSDVSFRLLNGVALVLGNRIQEGIRELNPIQFDHDFSMAATLALIYAHKRCTVVDKEALIALDTKLKADRKTLTPSSSYNAALFLFLSEKFDKAKDYVERALKGNPDFPEALNLLGWCKIRLSVRPDKAILELFTRSLDIKRTLDAQLGEVKYYQSISDSENALNLLTRISVRHPELILPLAEKMKTQLGNWNWEHANETASRILNLEPTNIEALQVKGIIQICRDGNAQSAAMILRSLFSAVERAEATNCELFYQIGQLFNRVSGRDAAVLSEALRFAEKAVQIAPENAAYLTELGYISIGQNRFKEANKYLRAATKVDDSSVLALCGLTLCQLMESGVTEQVRQQIEFLNEIQAGEKIPLLLFMSAKLHSDTPDVAIQLLIETCEIQFKNLRTLSYGAEYLRQFDPDFLLNVAKELLKFSPIQQSVSAGGETVSREVLHPALTHSLNILDAIVKACPGSVESLYLMARVQYLSGENTFATITLNRILQEIDPSYTEAHLLAAQIHIQQKSLQRASQSLEICLSHDFKVRENPLYHLLTGIVQKSQTLFDDAIKSFLTAMTLCGITHSSVSIKKLSPVKTNAAVTNTLSLVDKVTLYLEAIETYTILNQREEAAKLMQTAMDEFSNTAEKGRLIISNADIFLQQGKVNRALELLASIGPKQPYYLQAKTKMADVYLKHRKDRMAFAQCFKELVENNPGPESFLMLGDAYMSIQEPDEAIDAYREALRQSPRDTLLASKMGRAYVKTHQYKKAIAYYRDAITNPENFALKLDLAELYLKLKQFSDAEAVLAQELQALALGDEDIAQLQLKTKQLLLLARVREKAGNLNSSLSTLQEARDNQMRVQKRLAVEQTGNLQEQNRILAKICVLMAEQSISLRDNGRAIQNYREALKHSPQDVAIMAALAKLNMQMNEMEQCQRICSSILELEPNNETASVMMADISFRQMDFDNAAYHFSQLLLTKPTYWTALARLIEVMRRSGTIEEAAPFLQRAEEACPRPDHEPGLNFCKGAYEWYTGNPNGALRLFNNSRRDHEWGQQAIFNMIEICLNPDNELPVEGLSDGTEDYELRDSKQMALRTAERLLKELRPRPGVMDDEALNHLLAESFLLLATRTRFNVEKALQDFTVIASQDEYREHAGAIYGIAAANVVLKQQQRAKNGLKRIAKNAWSFEEAEYLERAWLLLADIYTAASKYDMATELLQRVLKHNKSCAKAYELSGYVAEKESNWKAAASHYDAAWKYGGHTKPNIGYKLAYSNMKAKRYADAIDVCQQVLKAHPDYPSIRKDILEKCRNNLKI